MSDGGQSGGWVVVFVHGEGAVKRALADACVVRWVEMPAKKEERVFHAPLRLFNVPLNKRYGNAPMGTFRSAVVQPD